MKTAKSTAQKNKKDAHNRLLIMIAAPLLALAVIGASVAVYFTSADSSRAVVATLGGHDITAAELSQYVSNERAAVRSYFQANHGTSIGSDWHTPVNGEVPHEVLLQRALDNCFEDKALLIAAQQLDVADYVAYEDFLTALKTENTQRANALDEGEVVYGLASFGESNYRSHLLTAIKTALLAELSAEGGPLEVSEEEIAAYFAEHMDDWTLNGTTYEMREFCMYEDEALAKEFATRITAGESFDDLVEEYGQQGDVVEHSFARKNEQLYIRMNSAAYDAATALTPGATSDILYNGETYSVAILDGVVFDEEESYSSYASRIRRTIQEERLESYLEEALNSMEREVNEKQLAKITFE